MGWFHCSQQRYWVYVEKTSNFDWLGRRATPSGPRKHFFWHMPPVAARSSQVVNKIISPGAEKTRVDACDVREMWAAAERPVDELILSFRQKSFSVKLELHTQILSDFQEFFVSQNKAKNAGRSLKNAGNRLKCGISRTIAGWLTPMTSEYPWVFYRYKKCCFCVTDVTIARHFPINSISLSKLCIDCL